MKHKKSFFYHVAVAAIMLSFSACSADESAIDNLPEVTAPVTKGHSLTITAAINTGAKTRLVSSEGTNGIKFNWEIDDKLYMLSSTDGVIWADTYYTFAVKEIDTDASKASFVCDDFSFPTGTTHVKFVYTSASVSTKADLEKSAQTLGTQSGKVEDVAKYIHMETAIQSADSEEAVKELSATLVHSNAVMKVVIAKSDIEWGSSFAPTEITMKLQSSSIILNGTTDNTITVTNTAATWNADNQIVANVVVCTTGSATAGDRWKFTTKDGLGNSLTKVTTSAKVLDGGKRYQAPIAFVTGDYFPLLNSNFEVFAGEGGSLNEATKTIITGAYGASGWDFIAVPLDFSAYRYLVIKAEEGYGKGTQFRLFDEGRFWGGYQCQPVITDTQTVIDLEELQVGKDEAGSFTPERSLNKAYITLACIWSFGGEENKLVIDKIYLTNTKPDEPTPPGDGNTNIGMGDMEDTDESAF
jgi:hypothetical protein